MERVLYKLKRNTGGIWWSFTLRRAYLYKRQDLDIIEAWTCDITPAKLVTKKRVRGSVALMADDLQVYLIRPCKKIYSIGGQAYVGDV